MAVLNVKDFPDALYRKIRRRAKKECRSVAQEVICLLREATEQPKPLSIKTLRGLGKELWDEQDASELIAKERDAWD